MVGAGERDVALHGGKMREAGELHVKRRADEGKKWDGDRTLVCRVLPLVVLA
jgi:hypothetical protein